MRVHSQPGFTLLELMIVVAIIAVVSSMGFVMYRSSVELAEEAVVVKDLTEIHAAIQFYENQNGVLPGSLADLGLGELIDPWGHPYQFLNFSTIKGKGKKRKDRFVVPINTSFDLYSVGPDGKSSAPLTAANSQDDWIVGNDGDYIGSASGY